MAFVGPDHLGIACLAHRDIASQHKAGLGVLQVRQVRCIRPDPGLDLPRDRLDWAGRCRTAFAAVAFVLDQSVVLDLVILPTLGHGGQSGLGSFGCLKACGLQMKELLFDHLIFALLGFADCDLGALKSGLRIHDQPALSHAVVT